MKLQAVPESLRAAALLKRDSATAYNFIKKETQAQVFSCDFCEISKNTFFNRPTLVATSDTRATFLDISLVS